MKPVFEVCKPRPEVLSGKIEADIFAANLSHVVNQTAPNVYKNSKDFFKNTYPTEGLKTLLQEVFGRLSGKKADCAPFIRLETSFGGGKTHNLIALYHLAKNVKNLSGIDQFLNPSLLLARPARVAAIVGTDLDPVNGIRHGSITTMTPWGEMAYQLDGDRGYNLMAKSDQELIPPGPDILARLIGEEPTLIMIDEIAHYLRLVNDYPRLSGQISTFIHRLIEFVSSREKAVFILTLAELKDAYEKETSQALEFLKEAARISARKELVLKPTAEAEIASVIKCRLFESIDHFTAAKTARAYLDHYRKAQDKAVAIPPKSCTADYAQHIERAYPFHPELLDILTRKLASIPNFQQTRGVLRLLAHTVREIWRNKDADSYLIAPYHIDLSVEAILSELTGRLGRGEFVPVVQADIYSAHAKAKPAHAQKIDEDWAEKQKPPFARRIAHTIFLHSLIAAGVAGADPAELNLAVGAPGIDFDFIDQALSQLGDTCWYLDFDGHRYRFKTEPSIVKIIDDEMDNVSLAEAKQELHARIRGVYETKHFETVFFPEEPVSVDDDAKKPKLVILDFDSEKIESYTDPPPPLVKKIYERAGSQDAYRVYQNNLVFLVASADQIEPMIKMARRYKAISRITASPATMSDFKKEDQKKVKDEMAKSGLELRIAVTSAYRHLFYPDAGAAQSDIGLAHYPLPIQDASEVDKKGDQQAVIIRILREKNKALVADDKPLSAEYAKDKVWPPQADNITTEEFRRIFCKKRALPIVFVPDQIKKTIREGIEKGTWVFYDSSTQKGYESKSPPPLIQLTEDHILYTTKKAEELGIIKKFEEKKDGDNGKGEVSEACRLCGKRPCACYKPTPILRGDGTPNKAFQQLKDRCADGNVKTLSAITIACDTIDGLRRLSIALEQRPELKKAAEQEFSAEAEDDDLRLSYKGLWKRFAQVRAFVENFSKSAAKSAIIAKVRVEFPAPVEPEGEEMNGLLESFNVVDLGKIELEGHIAG